MKPHALLLLVLAAGRLFAVAGPVPNGVQTSSTPDSANEWYIYDYDRDNDDSRRIGNPWRSSERTSCLAVKLPELPGLTIVRKDGDFARAFAPEDGLYDTIEQYFPGARSYSFVRPAGEVSGFFRVAADQWFADPSPSPPGDPPSTPSAP